MIDAVSSTGSAAPGAERERGSEAPRRWTWVGPGATGFLMPTVPSSAPATASGGGSARTWSLSSEEEAEQLLAGSVNAARLGALALFFANGGRVAHVVESPGAPGESVHSWIGEDGGPGERTGLHKFLDLEQVGAVVVPPVRSSQVERLLELARTVDRLFFFLEEFRDSFPEDRVGLEVSRPLPNVVLVSHSREAPPAAAALAARLESLDFQPRTGGVAHGALPLAPAVGGRPRAGGELPGPEFPAGVLDELVRRRRWIGLRRSIDYGSRWVVFEPNHPLVWRRLEREVRAFVHRLVTQGFFARGGNPRLEVFCRPRGRPEEGRVVLEVRVDRS